MAICPAALKTPESTDNISDGAALLELAGIPRRTLNANSTCGRIEKLRAAQMYEQARDCGSKTAMWRQGDGEWSRYVVAGTIV
jgi:hypothetical protein